MSKSLTKSAGVFLSAAMVLTLAAGGVGSPVPSSRIQRVRKALARHSEQPLAVTRSEHFVIVHATTAERTEARARLLEATYHRFYDTFQQTQMDLHPLDRRLVCLLFADRGAFIDYARQVDWVDMSWSGGYYSSRTNRVALFATKQGRRSGDAARDRRVAVPPADGQTNASSLTLNPARTTHEATHQLAFNSGLQRRGVVYPFWVAEGLATAFEAPRGGGPFGLTEGNPARKKDLIEAWAGGDLMPLKRFLPLTRIPADHRRITAVYAQAWGLFEYLFKHRRTELAQYLARLRMQRAGPRSNRKLRAEFTAVFGPLDEVESQWRAWIHQQANHKHLALRPVP